MLLTIIKLAEGRGFEPPVGLRLRLISSQVPLTTQPPFQPPVFTRYFAIFAKTMLTFVACIHAIEYRQPKDLAKVVSGKLILLRTDWHILRQTPHQGQGKGEVPQNRQVDRGKTAVARERNCTQPMTVGWFRREVPLPPAGWKGGTCFQVYGGGNQHFQGFGVEPGWKGVTPVYPTPTL